MKRVILISIVVTILLGYSKVETQVVEIQNTKVVETWLSMFTTKDFDKCDTLVQNKNNSFHNIFITKDIYYDYTLEKLSDSIKNLKIDITDNNYTINLTFTRYKELDKLSIDTKVVKSLLNSKDIAEDLNKIYFDTFKSSCFIRGTENTIVLNLKEKDNKVEDTNIFINTLLEETNILNNIKVFNSNIKRDINYELQRGD